jgi:hypothetical protein
MFSHIQTAREGLYREAPASRTRMPIAPASERLAAGRPPRARARAAQIAAAAALGSAVAVAGFLSGGLEPTSAQVRAHEAALSPPIAGASLRGSDFQFVATIDQVGSAFSLTGYLTHLAGVPDQDLFSGSTAAQSESTALITFSGLLQMQTRATLESLIAISSAGSATFYLRPGPGASFSDPASFAVGTPIATASISYWNVTNVQAPNHGVELSEGWITEATSTSFALAGTRYRFGKVGFVGRILATGEGVRTQLSPLHSTIILAGNVTTP